MPSKLFRRLWTLDYRVFHREWEKAWNENKGRVVFKGVFDSLAGVIKDFPREFTINVMHHNAMINASINNTTLMSP
ncbi:hypothetical protein ACFSL6_26960 [Paenibacillus thailandensis]|uniref:hypothetical protein n=1 Tax=Paenibacillus thailandensis TaxID=393250 RepID=UPI0036288CC7